jgi:hypothetical protein
MVWFNLVDYQFVIQGKQFLEFHAYTCDFMKLFPEWETYVGHFIGHHLLIRQSLAQRDWNSLPSNNQFSNKGASIVIPGHVRTKFVGGTPCLITGLVILIKSSMKWKAQQNRGVMNGAVTKSKCAFRILSPPIG